MSEKDPTTFWVKFFTDAGIPTSEAANHAVTFVQHRITCDMLLDLTKEYLNDMNITMMGDVIAILKHAKAVVSQNSKSKLLKGVMINPITGAPVRSTAASRTVAHYLRSGDGANAAKPISLDLASRLGSGPSMARSNSPSLVSLSKMVRSTADNVPVPKARRVLPEHEGKYKVTMPKGLTPRSRRLLAKSLRANAEVGITASTESGSVFSRLGAGVNSSPSTEPASSVFNRLGGAVKRAATSTVPGTDDSDDMSDMDDDVQSVLGYHGVLKHTPAKRLALDTADDMPPASIKRTVNVMPAASVQTPTTATSDDSSDDNDDDDHDTDGMATDGGDEDDAVAVMPSTEGIFSPFSAAAKSKSVNERLGKQERVGKPAIAERLGKPVIAEAQTTTTVSSSAGKTAMTKAGTTSTRKGVLSRLGPVKAASKTPTTASAPTASASTPAAASAGSATPVSKKPSGVKASSSQGSSVFSRLGKQL